MTAVDSLHRKQFDLEDQRGVGGDGAAGAAGAVAELGQNDEGALAADLPGGSQGNARDLLGRTRK